VFRGPHPTTGGLPNAAQVRLRIDDGTNTLGCLPTGKNASANPQAPSACPCW